MSLDYFTRLLNVVISTPTTCGIIGNDRYLTFTSTSTNYTFTTTEQLNVDILIVTGGRGGGREGGGGTGGLIYVSNQTINTGNYNISVGRGGTIGVNGINSS
jgi:hypothetical protein